MARSSAIVGTDLVQSCIAMRVVKVNVELRVSVKELGYFAFLTKCGIGQQPVFGWIAVVPAALIALIFMRFGHVSQNAALMQTTTRIRVQGRCREWG